MLDILNRKPMSTAPKNIPILAWCDHEAGERENIEQYDGKLTLYVAHGDGGSYAPTGWHIIVWGGAFDDSTWEYPNQANLPDWWFVAASEYEQAANPIFWVTTLPVVEGYKCCSHCQVIFNKEYPIDCDSKYCPEIKC